MEITKEILMADLENYKAHVQELLGVIKYTKSLIEFIEKKGKEEKKDDGKKK